MIVVGQDMWHCSGVGGGGGGGGGGVEYTCALEACSFTTSQHQYIGCHGNRDLCDALVPHIAR